MSDESKLCSHVLQEFNEQESREQSGEYIDNLK